jgi:hypothetical protein
VIRPKRGCGGSPLITGVASQRGSAGLATARTTTDARSRPLRSVSRQQPSSGIVSRDGNCVPGTARIRCVNVPPPSSRRPVTTSAEPARRRFRGTQSTLLGTPA